MRIDRVVPNMMNRDGQLDQIYDTSLPREQRVAAQQTWDLFDRETHWWWFDPDRHQLKERMATAYDFRQRMAERPLMERAYADGEDMEISDAMWWPTALGRSDPTVLPGSIGSMEQTLGGDRGETARMSEMIQGTPPGSQIKFITRGGQRVTQGFFGDQLLWETSSPEYTANPFLDQRPGLTAKLAPLNVVGQASEVVTQLVDGVIGFVPGVNIANSQRESVNWLHQMGIRPGSSVGRNYFDAQGRVQGDVMHDDPSGGIIDAYTGGEAGFFYREDIGALPAGTSSRAAFDATAWGYGEIHEEEDGGAWIAREEWTDPETGERFGGEEMDLIPFRPDTPVVFYTESGERMELNYSDFMKEASNALAGGKVRVDSILGHFFHGPDDWVMTGYGKLLVPKITGNKLIDRDLMRDPRFLRSLKYADAKYGNNFWTTFSQETLGLVEIGVNIAGGKLALGVVGTALRRGGVALRRGGAARGLAAAPVPALIGKTLKVMGRTISPPSAAVTVKSVYTFNPAFAGWFAYHEVMKHAITGEGTLPQAIQAGVSGGVAFWAFGSAARVMLGIGGAVVGRGATRLKLDKFSEWYKKYETPVRIDAMMVDRARRALLNTPGVRKIEGMAAEIVDREIRGVVSGQVNRAAFRHVLHSFLTGALMTSYGEAHRLAMEAGEDISWTDGAFWPYWREAFTGGRWIAGALAFATTTSAEYAAGRAYSKAKHGDSLQRFLSEPQELQLKALNEKILRDLDLLASDPEAMIPIFEAFGGRKPVVMDTEEGWRVEGDERTFKTEAEAERVSLENFVTPGEIDQILKATLGPNQLMADIESQTTHAPTIDYLAKIAQGRGGPIHIEKILAMASNDHLYQMEGQARNASKGAEADVPYMAAVGRVLAQIQGEISRRARGAQPAERPERPPAKPKVEKPDIPTDEWPQFFGQSEQALIGGARRERYRYLGGAPFEIVELRNEEGQEPVYGIVRTGQRRAAGDLELWIPKEYEYSERGLREAMGDVLAKLRVRKADKALVAQLKKAKGEPPEMVEAKPPDQKVEVDIEALDMIEGLEEVESARGVEVMEAMRRATKAIRAEQEGPEGVVFHGSAVPAADLKISDGLGVHVGTERAATDRLRHRAERGEDVSKGQVLSYKHDLQRVIPLSGDPGVWTPESIGRELAREGHLEKQWVEELLAADLPRDVAMGRIRAKLLERGIDALSYENTAEDPGSTSLVVLDQAKLKAVRGQGKKRDVQPHITKKPEPKKDPPVPVPEKQETIDAQMAALVAGRKPAVLITPGEKVPQLPAGFTARSVPRGTLIAPEGKIGDAIAKLAENPRTEGLALGYGVGQKGATDKIVTARDAKGRVVADVVSAGSWRVIQALKHLAGPGGSVERRTAMDALAERTGAAVPLSLAPAPEGSRPPTAGEVIQAREAVAAALEGRRGFGGLSGEERANEYLRDADLGSVEALQARVNQAQTSPPPPLVPKSVATPNQPGAPSSRGELDAELLEIERQTAPGNPKEQRARIEAVYAALQEAQKAQQSMEVRLAAERARAGEGPGASLWSGPLGEHSTKERQVRIGADFWQPGASVDIVSGVAENRFAQEEAVMASTQAGILRDLYRSLGREAEARIEEQRLELHTIGHLLATGVTPPATGKQPGFQPLIARLTNQPVAKVEAVRQKMIRAGAVLDPIIEERLARAVNKHGRRLISPQQLHRTVKAGRANAGMQHTMDLLRVVALAPPIDMRAGRGKMPQGGRKPGSLARRFKDWLDRAPVVEDTELPQPRKLLQAKLEELITPEQAAKVMLTLEAQIERLGEARTGRKNLTDIVGRLQSRIAHTQLGEHTRGGESKVTTIEGEPALAEVTEGLIQLISGQPIERRATSVSITRADRLGPKGELVIESAGALRAEEATEADPSNLVGLYHEAAREQRELLIELMDLRLGPGGELILPRSKTEGPDILRGLDATHVANLMRRLAQRDTTLEQLVHASAEPDGTPTYADPAAAWEIMTTRASKIQAASQHMAVVIVKERYDEASAEQVRAILQALEATNTFGPAPHVVPAHLIEALAKPTEAFPRGALDAAGKNVDTFIAESLPEIMWDWVQQQGVSIDGVPHASEVVRFFAGPASAMMAWREGTGGQYKPIRIEALSLGKLLGHDNPNAKTWSDLIAEHAGIFGTRDGRPNALGRYVGKILSFWSGTVARQIRSSANPRRVIASNLALRHGSVDSRRFMDRAQEATSLWMKRAADMHMSTAEANTLGKIMAGGGVNRMHSKEDWIAQFGDRRADLYDRLIELTDIFNSLGQYGVEIGLWDAETARTLFDGYLPILHTLNTKTKARNKARAKLGIGIQAGSPRERPRDGVELDVGAHENVFDVRQAAPLAVWQEITIGRVWDALNRLRLSSEGILSGESHELMPELGRGWWRKATEEGRHPDRKVHERQVRLHQFFEAAEQTAKQNEARTGRGMTEIRRKIIDAYRDGYLTKAAGKEIDMMLDQADPTMDMGVISSTIQQITLQWRRLKTIQRPQHWVLNWLTSLLTNHITDKLSIFDFIRSAATGRGIYAEAIRDVMNWHDHVRQGRPELNTLDPKSLGIMRVDRMAGELGGGTMVRTVFGRTNMHDMLEAMFTPDIESKFETTDGGFSGELVRQVSGVKRRQGRWMGRWDERLAKGLGVPDPRAQAEAIADLNEMYYVHEIILKYAAALSGGRYRGLNERDAAIWAAEGTADYLGIAPDLRRATTQFTATITDATRIARETLGKSRELNVAQQFLRMGVGSPFWMYYASMWPTLGKAMVDRPLRVAFTYGLMSMIIQGIDEVTGGDRDDLEEALAGRGDELKARLQPETLRELSRRYGQLPAPNFGGGIVPAWLRPSIKDWLASWQKLPESQAFAKAPGPGETVIDLSELFMPGLGGTVRKGRALANLGDRRPPSDIEGIPDTFGVGFLPSAIAHTVLNIWDLAAGVKGQSRRESTIRTVGRMFQEIFPTLGPGMFLSAVGQRGLLEVDGRTLRDVGKGLPGPGIEFWERMARFGSSLLAPTQRVMQQSVARRDISAGEEILRLAGLRLRALPAGAPDVRLGEVLSTAVGAYMRQAMVSAYREYMSPSNLMPLQLIANRNLELGPDMRGFVGQRQLVNAPTTRTGRFIARLVGGDHERGLAVSAWESLMAAKADVMQKVALMGATKRQMHPAVYARVVDSLMRGGDTAQNVLDFLYEVTVSPNREEWAEPHSYQWVRMWENANLVSADFTGTKSLNRWTKVAEWVDANRSTSNTGGEFLHPIVWDAPGLNLERPGPSQRLAPPDIMRIIR